MIQVKGLKKVYHQAGREVRALDGVTLTVPPDTVHGVIGQSGAGKSTLVRCLALLDRPTSGSVELNGIALTDVPSSELRSARRRLGVVFQHANLFDSRTLVGNVAYPLEVAGIGSGERTSRARELLGLVGLADAAEAYPAQLSGGQRQRVGIARALATDPQVLLCDEPTSALDPATTGEILDLIAALKARLGLAVLIITHEMSVVKRSCDSVSLLQAGRIVESGSLEQVVGSFQSRLSEALLGLPHLAATSALPNVEVLDAVAPGGIQVLAEAGRRLGVDLPVVAGTIEQLGSRTFHRYRVQVPTGTDAGEVVALLAELGARAALSAPFGTKAA